MAALFQRGRSMAAPAGRFERPSPANFASEAPDSSESDSDDSDKDVAAAPSSFRATGPLEDLAAPATPGARPVPAGAAAAAPNAALSKAGFLRRLGALRRSVSPAKRGAAGQQNSEQSPQKPVPAARKSVAKPTAADPHESRHPSAFGAASSRNQELGRGAGEGHEAEDAAKTARMPRHPQSLGSHPLGWHQGLNTTSVASTAAMLRQESAAARLSENGSHHAAAVAGIARSGSDASSLATETTVASSGVSLGLGNARTAADSYGGSVFASALNQEAGLQLLTQVCLPFKAVKDEGGQRCGPARHKAHIH